MNYNKLNNLLGWSCGILATLIYIMSVERSSSWWDNGEFIASAYKLEVVHQPGAPLFLMLQNVFSNLAMGDVSKIAYWMNIGSAICSGLTIVFLFWTITAIAKKLVLNKSEWTSSKLYQVFGAGIVGALAYSFTDSFWYSAIESEVYSMSSLCTAVVFWLALKWDARADQADSNKWLILIAYVMGLSIGVHLLNLLTIPVIALMIYFRKATVINWKGISKSLAIGVSALAFVLWGVIQYSVRFAANFDLFFVNTLGMPFGTGVTVFIVLIVAGIVYGIYYSVRHSKVLLNLSLLSLSFILLGFGSYSLLLIRSQTNITLNNYDPDNAFNLLSYLSREQYQSEPLFKGQTFDAKRIDVKEGSTYRKDKDRYREISSNVRYVYDKEMLFPRIYSDKHTDFYRQYLNIPEGQSPTMADNLKFFFNYQLNHMYTRYFLWNFVGRQNDTPSQGQVYAGNWLSGITFIDNIRLAGQDHLSERMLKDPSRNTYFFLPLLLGIIGILWQLKKSKRDTAILGMLFFVTGLAIVIYLNQTPLQPRERDYAYAGSFYVFAIWIGLGVIGMIDILQKFVKLPARTLALATSVVCLLAVPTLLLKQNWDDHNRDERLMTRDFALNMLNSCAPNAILFTYADNDTFPLWYLQETEGVRPDVRILNYGYLQSDWYVEQALTDMNESKALPLGFSYDKVKRGIRDGIQVYDMGVEGYTDVKTVLDIMLSDNQQNMMQLQSGEYVNVMPTKKLQLKINKDQVLKNNVVPDAWKDSIPEYMQWDYNQSYVSRAELSLMGLLEHNNWERPIYFVKQAPNDIFMGMDKYLASEGLVYRLMPVEVGQETDHPSLLNTDAIYSNAVERFKWKDIKSLDHFDTDSNFIYESYIQPNLYAQGLENLVQQKKLSEAKKLALVAYSHQPKEPKSMRQTYLNTILTDTLVRVKELDKAKEMAAKNINAIDEQLNYQLGIMKAAAPYDLYSIQLGLGALEKYQAILKDIGDASLIAEGNRVWSKYEQAWLQGS